LADVLTTHHASAYRRIISGLSAALLPPAALMPNLSLRPSEREPHFPDSTALPHGCTEIPRLLASPTAAARQPNDVVPSRSSPPSGRERVGQCAIQRCFCFFFSVRHGALVFIDPYLRTLSGIPRWRHLPFLGLTPMPCAVCLDS
jgi:hypothetical protein